MSTSHAELYAQLPKAALYCGIVAAYQMLEEGVYTCLFRLSGEWVKAKFERDDIIEFMPSGLSEDAMETAHARFPEYTVVQLDLPLSQRPLDAQVRQYDPRGYHCGWQAISDKHHIGYVNQNVNTVVVLHEADLFHHSQRIIKADSCGWGVQGLRKFKPTLITPAVFGFAPRKLGRDDGALLADKVREFHRTKYKLLSN